MCDAGNAAVFTKAGGYIVPEGTVREMVKAIENRGQRTLRMKRENGMYNFDLWIQKPRETRGSNQGFQRQGVRLRRRNL